MLTCTCGFRGYAGYLREYEYLTQRRQWLAGSDRRTSPPPDRPPRRLTASGRPGHNRRPHPAEGLGTDTSGHARCGLLISLAWCSWRSRGNCSGRSGSWRSWPVRRWSADSPPSGCGTCPPDHRSTGRVAFALGLIVAAAGPGLGALPEDWGISTRPTPGSSARWQLRSVRRVIASVSRHGCGWAG